MYFVVFLVVCDVFDTVLTADVNRNRKLMEIYDLTDGLVTALGVDLETSADARISELEDKLKKINQYVIDKDNYAMLLKNITTQSNLNETNFYRALNADEDFKFLTNKESKNLYLQMKENMNRDDIMKILSEKGGDSYLSKSARKVMGHDNFGTVPDGDVVDFVVDKMLGETPKDDHKFDARQNESIYWDPQIELEEMKEHHQHSGRRIFRGERTTIRYYPFMVSIHIMDRFWCGGVLYWHDLVLTSASCLQLMHNNRFFRENPKVLRVRIGSNHSRISGEVVDALEVYFHPSYNPRTLKNNIAVIRLRRHLYFNYHRIPKIITISHSPHSIPATDEVLLLGWGVTKISQKMSYEPVYLQRKRLPVYPNMFCKEVYGSKFVSDSMFCAGTFTTGEGACDHDAGGPAIVSGKLVGIISFGPAVCGYPNTPTVFTLVGAFADWIETINETMPGYYRGKVRTTSSTYRPMFHFLKDYYKSTTSTERAKIPIIPEISPAQDLTTPTTTTMNPIRFREYEGLNFDLN